MTELQPWAILAKGPAMDQRRVVFQRLHQIGLQGIAQQHRHRAIGADIAGGHRLAVGVLADHDPAQPRLKIRQIRGQAQDRHQSRRPR